MGGPHPGAPGYPLHPNARCRTVVGRANGRWAERGRTGGRRRAKVSDLAAGRAPISLMSTKTTLTTIVMPTTTRMMNIITMVLARTTSTRLRPCWSLRPATLLLPLSQTCQRSPYRRPQKWPHEVAAPASHSDTAAWRHRRNLPCAQAVAGTNPVAPRSHRRRFRAASRRRGQGSTPERLGPPVWTATRLF